MALASWPHCLCPEGALQADIDRVRIAAAIWPVCQGRNSSLAMASGASPAAGDHDIRGGLPIDSALRRIAGGASAAAGCCTIRRMTPRILAVLYAACGLACASTPSARWETGGAQIALGSAYWNDDGQVVELHPNGEVYTDDELLFRIDAGGRVSDGRGKPAAVLMADGRLLAEDDASLGWVGAGSALYADGETRSVHLFPTGQIFVADEEGEWEMAGQWVGCDRPMVWTCTLVSHVLSVRHRKHGHGGGSGAGDLLKLLEVLKVLR